MSPRRRAAMAGFARGLGWVLGPIVLFCLLPWAACRLMCVPLRVTCEEAGGEHMSAAHFDSCVMPHAVDRDHPCPPGYHANPTTDPDLCHGNLLGLACAPPGLR